MLLEEKLRALMLRDKFEGMENKGFAFVEATKRRSKVFGNIAWVDVSESVPRESMGTLTYYLVRSWKDPPNSPHMQEKWKHGRRLLGS